MLNCLLLFGKSEYWAEKKPKYQDSCNSWRQEQCEPLSTAPDDKRSEFNWHSIFTNELYIVCSMKWIARSICWQSVPTCNESHAIKRVTFEKSVPTLQSQMKCWFSWTLFFVAPCSDKQVSATCAIKTFDRKFSGNEVKRWHWPCVASSYQPHRKTSLSISWVSVT